MYVFCKNLLFSTLILDSIFSDCAFFTDTARAFLDEIKKAKMHGMILLDITKSLYIK